MDTMDGFANVGKLIQKLNRRHWQNAKKELIENFQSKCCANYEENLKV